MKKGDIEVVAVHNPSNEPVTCEMILLGRCAVQGLTDDEPEELP